jgi:DNA repair photolyase
VERKLKITRRCLEVLVEFRNPVGIVTKNHLVTRDIDLLSQLAAHRAVVVFVSVTTLDAALASKLEPRASLPQHRLAAIRALHAAAVPVGVLVAPVIPALTDHEMPAILKAAAAAGASCAGYTALRLPYGLGPLFEDWLSRHFPERKEKVLNRVRAMRGGKINDPNFGSRMRGEGVFADQIAGLFDIASRKAGLSRPSPRLSAAAFRVPAAAHEPTQGLLAL